MQLRALGAFAAIAFLLAAVGIHGLLSFAVSQRSQEIGVRIALGARWGNILTMVLRQGMLLSVAGLLPGVALAYAAGRAMESLLAGVKPADTITFRGRDGTVPGDVARGQPLARPPRRSRGPSDRDSQRVARGGADARGPAFTLP